MLRYLAFASAIVALAILAILALGHSAPPRDATYSTKLASPGHPRIEGETTASAAPLAGDAPWALSALPECFRQTFEASGSHALARKRARADPQIGFRVAWHRIERAALRTADCRLDVASETAIVVRGDTRLAIPPHARFYVAGNNVVLDRSFDGVETIRSYRLVDGRAPVFRTQ